MDVDCQYNRTNIEGHHTDNENDASQNHPHDKQNEELDDDERQEIHHINKDISRRLDAP